MNIPLDPVVVRRLQQFARRRRLLLLARGLSAGLSTFLLCLFLAALVDWYWLLTDSQRWVLSACVYLPSLLATWLACGGQLLRVPGSDEIAMHVEQTEPQLREKLLAAVELAADDPGSRHDSAMFRGLLQGEVAAEMQRVQPSAVLPFRLVARWTVAACVIGAVFLALLAAPDAGFRRLAVRSILPMANLARVSRVQVQILQPTPHSLLLPEEEAVAVIVQTSGGRVSGAVLEVRSRITGLVQHEMQRQDAARFSANVRLDSGDVDYRILAGDAVTEWHRIQTRPRPRVEQFTKRLEFPEYSQLPPVSTTAEDGHLQALEGTTAHLTIQPNQPISAAELRLNPLSSEEIVVIPLVRQPRQDATGGAAQPAAELWTASVPMQEPGTYRVHLVSQETGFENEFSPRYEIRPQPDLIPRVGFVDQQQTTLLLPPDDILQLHAMAEDDLPLVSLEQQISINGNDWISLPLQTEDVPGSEGCGVTAQWPWDLVPHMLRPGDQLLTKLSAVDRRGSRGESAPLRIVIADRQFDPERHTQMQQKLELQPLLAKLAMQLGEQKTAATAILERLKSLPADAAQTATDRAALLDLAGRQRQAAETALQQAQAIVLQMPPGADAADLELTGRMLARLAFEHTTTLQATLQTLALPGTDQQQQQADFDALKRGFETAADDAGNLAEHFSWMASWNLFDAASRDLELMLQHQEFVVNSPTQTWRRLVRQESLLVTHLESFEQLLQEQRTRLPEPLVSHATRLIDWSITSRDQLQQAMESEDRLNQLQALSKSLRDQLLQYQKVDVLDSTIPGRLQNAWRDLDNRSGMLAGVMDSMAALAAERRGFVEQAARQREAADSVEKILQLEQQAARSATRLMVGSQPSLQQLRSRQRLTESRVDADLQYAADAGLALRAIDAVMYLQQTEDPDEDPDVVKLPEQLREIGPAWRTLEAGHELSLAVAAMTRLQELERWSSRQRTARIDQPRHWDLLQHTLDVAVRRLSEARVEATVINRLNQTRWSADARDAGRRIAERRWRREVLTAAGHELDSMSTEMTAALTELQPAMAAARAVLARYAPTISQMAERAAAEVRELEEKTLQAADAAEDQPPAETQPQVAELQQQQQQVNDQIQDLLQALVEDAQRQDLSDDQQRERARDSDDSLALIQPPAERMNQELQQAAAEDAARQQELSQAAEQQEQTAKALDTVARHFKALENGQELADTRAELRKAEDQGLAPELSEQYQQAAALDQQFSRSADQQLQELEAELQRNPAMQAALSEIARNALAEAESVVKDAAAEDQSLQQANERSDADFQERKRELAEDLRQIGTEAAQLSGQLVAQAAQAAAQGKSPEAQAKLSEAQQKLNAAAAAASSAREEQLLAELQQTATNAQQALQEATGLLDEGRKQTAAAKEQTIFPDAAARDNQQKNSEKQRQAFVDQRKRSASDAVKQSEDANRRAEQAVKNVENEMQAAERRVTQVQDQLNKKPDDAGLKQQLAAQQQQQQAVQDRLDTAVRQRERATQRVQAAQQTRDQVNNTPLPPLNAANPAAQLSEQYAAEAADSLEKIKQAAAGLQTDFGNQLTPAQNQLAGAQQRQQELTQDVQTAAADVARAARHERRLNKPAVADALQQAAQSLQQAASGESTAAEQQLAVAATEAGQQAAQPQTPPANAQALEAQRDLETAEQAFLARANQIEQVLSPLQQAAAAAAAAAAEAAIGPEPATTQPANAQPAGEQPAAAQPGDAQPAGNPPAGAQPAAPAATPTPEQQAQAMQLAQTLDELDRQLATAQAGQSEGQQPRQQTQQAQARQNRLADARRQAQQRALQALGQAAAQPSDGFSEPPDAQPFDVTQVNRVENAKWGKLRGQAAEDVARGRGEQISEAYRKSVETYFRVLSERARKPQ